MDKLSVCRIILLQPKPKLGRTNPSTGPRVGHSCLRCLQRSQAQLQKICTREKTNFSPNKKWTSTL